MLTDGSFMVLAHWDAITPTPCHFLYGLPQSSISKLQCIQNAAARLLMGTKTFEHITPVLKSLHWLLVEKRINFEVLLLVYCALRDHAPEYTRYAPGEN